MANISNTYIDKLEQASLNDLNRPLVFVIDMINGFIKEGNLSDKSIMSIVKDIKRLLDGSDHAVFVGDAHNLDAREFDAYPIHCIENTYEADVIKELKPYVKEMLCKNSTNTFVATGFQERLDDYLLKYDDFVLVGCCSDICIMQFALTLQTFFNESNMDRKRIIVPINMIETFHIDKVHDQKQMNQIACDLMLANGIHVVDMR